MAKRNNVIKSNPFDDIQVVGIATGLIDFELAWNVNKQLNIDLVKQEDIFLNEFSKEIPFSFYLFDEGENQNIYNLLALSSQGTYWTKLPVKVDYFLIIRNVITDEKLKEVVNAIKKISSVIHAFCVDVNTIKKKEHEIAIYDLLEQIEIHHYKLMNEKNKKLPRIIHDGEK